MTPRGQRTTWTMSRPSERLYRSGGSECRELPDGRLQSTPILLGCPKQHSRFRERRTSKEQGSSGFCQCRRFSSRISRQDDNESVTRTNREELLLNLVRLRYSDTPEVLPIGSIASQLSWDYSANGSGAIGHDAPVRPTGSRYTIVVIRPIIRIGLWYAHCVA